LKRIILLLSIWYILRLKHNSLWRVSIIIIVIKNSSLTFQWSYTLKWITNTFQHLSFINLICFYSINTSIIFYIIFIIISHFINLNFYIILNNILLLLILKWRHFILRCIATLSWRNHTHHSLIVLKIIIL